MPVKNTNLQKSGRFLSVGQKRNNFQPVQEIPMHWDLDVKPNANGDAPSIFIGRGMSIDGAYMPFRVELSQGDIELAPGSNYVNLRLHSDVEITTGSKSLNAVGWFVEFEVNDGRKISNNERLLISPTKGDQSFSVQIVSPNYVIGTLRIIYLAEYGNTNGSMKVHSVGVSPLSIYPERNKLNIPDIEPDEMPSLSEDMAVLFQEIEDRLDRLKSMVNK